ncbi:M16 family metallopeptidase [Caulobacter mirabilis]|uniref:Peptidase M16 n=1 Tax=Caulobacter mirabilis TaxID=69666 RepID=A0A2D2B2C1_9CAUL|nr:pitrilysin family protein [Caulobacter mirabilis]ATQ44409.1 peptidase M16 [Caulobacter mirabilis]
MKYKSVLTAAVLAAAFGVVAPADSWARPAAKGAPALAPLPDVNIPYTKFVLPNGLTVIVHEDRKAPIVAVNVWYHVGSKDEPQGRTGFAHLFEHLMFNGSENADEDWFKALEQVGATDLNGTTNTDRTNYFQNVPTAALDQVLWLEADRMGRLLGAVTQAKLDEQRGVVQNEKREGDNEPYAVAWDLITTNTYRQDHPYGHTVIGSMEDLDAAKLEDVHAWFKKYYGPANATLVLAGDISPAEARKKVEAYFGDLPSGPPVPRQTAWPAKRTGEQRATAQDRVPQPRLYKVWNVPEAGAADTDYLALLSDVLASDKSARLYERFVLKEQTATSVSAYVSEGELGSTFGIVVTVKPGGDIDAVEKAVDAELAKLLKEGPTEAELARIKTSRVDGFIRGVERIGGFGGKSDLLAQSQVFHGSPDAWKQSLNRYRGASVADLKAAGNRWLTDGVFSLQITPFTARETGSAAAPPRPAVGQIAAPVFDSYQRAKLTNGVDVVFARRTAVPTIDLTLIMPTTSSSRTGLAGMTLDMMDEGTATRDTIAISREQTELGAQISTTGGMLYNYASLSALAPRLEPSLDLFVDILRNPAFREADIDRLKKLRIASLKQSRQQPNAMANRVLFPRVYGVDHPYGRLITEQTIDALNRDALTAYHQQWIKPQGATLVVVGDTTLEQILPLLEKRFGTWTAAPPPARAEIPPAAPKPGVYLIDKPGAVQSVLTAAFPMAPRVEAEQPATEVMNNTFGGAFVSRLNMNLREDKHWSYGAFSFVNGSIGPRAFVASTSVQTDKTGPSLVEMKKEFADIVGSRPVTASELAKSQDDLVRSLPGFWETASAVSSSLGQIVTLGLPADHFTTYPKRVRDVTAAEATAAARKAIHPDQAVWVIVGDRAKIEKEVRAAGLGSVTVVDADGNPVP